MIRVHATLLISLFTLAMGSHAEDLWVSKTGTNTLCGPTKELACSSIQNALASAEAGDTINIVAGTYIEDSSDSPYTDLCTWLGEVYSSLCVPNSGTETSPITIQAAPGSEKKVIIDSEYQRIGLHLMKSDYITVKNLVFRNNFVIGIGSWGQVQNEVPNEDTLGIGIRIENNTISNTYGPYGFNISGIGMWGSKDWVVRNNFIQNVSSERNRDASCIQAYGVINALIEYNDMHGCASGIFWKDHYIANNERELVTESEIRYNRISAYQYGVQLGVRGSGTVEAGHNHIHHNQFYNYQGAAIYGNMAAAYAMSGSLTIENNLFDGRKHRSNVAISIDAFDSAAVTGNIFAGNNIDLEVKKYNDDRVTKLVNIDHNIYDDSSFAIFLERYSDSSKIYRDLSEWSQVSASDSANLSVSQPDSNSQTQIMDNVIAGDTIISYPANSAAIDFITDGNNAGPLQTTPNALIGTGINAPKGPSGVMMSGQ